MRTRAKNRYRVAVIAAAVAGVSATALAQTTYTWNGGSSDWNTATNWTPNGIPGAPGDIVDITGSDGNPFAVTYDYNGTASALNSLTVDLTGGTAAATLAMAANNLDAGSLYVGVNGNALFNESGGFVSISALDMGVNAGSTGSYLLTGSSNLSGGTENIGISGAAVFTQSGGTNSYSTMMLGPNGSYNLAAGVLSGGTIDIANSTTFTQSGGTNHYSAVMLGPAGVYNMVSGILTGGTVDVTGGATFTQSGGNFVSAALNESGGSVSLTPLTLGAGGTGDDVTLSGGAFTCSTININSGGDFSYSRGTVVCSNLNLQGGVLSFPTAILDSGNYLPAFSTPPGVSPPTVTLISGTLNPSTQTWEPQQARSHSLNRRALYSIPRISPWATHPARRRAIHFRRGLWPPRMNTSGPMESGRSRKPGVTTRAARA